MNDDRPHPDDLLARVRADEAQQRRGKLKIFFGMAPGVGKTYAMLEAARKAAKEGVDVVVGYVEPHARPETQALVLGLEVLPRRPVDHRGQRVLEFDLEGALARRPQVLLVDELAHTNAEGLTHAKRWQDVEDLLAAGVDVYTTLNVQHLESLNDVVAQVTSIPVRETVPDGVFERADEVELVDLAPDDLIGRIRDGKVYVSQQASRAIENFFRKGNLFALRELALRKTAERVNAQALNYRHENAVASIWATSERLLVCIGPSPLSARLIRAARRLAATLRAPWMALHVELENRPIVQAADQQRLQQNLRLAEQLGATIVTVTGARFAEAVLRCCREKNVTKVIVGRPLQGRLSAWLHGDLVQDLIRESNDVDVYVINGDREDETSPNAARREPPSAVRWGAYAWATAVVLLCTLLCLALTEYLQATNAAMVYLACVVAMSYWYGRGPSILATVLSVACFDAFFVPPLGTFAVSDVRYVVTFFVMLATGLVVSELSARVRSQSAAIVDREHRTAALYALSRELSQSPNAEAVILAAQRIIREALDVEAWIVPVDVGGVESLNQPPPAGGQASSSPRREYDAAVIRWVAEHRRAAGFGTDTLPGADATYLPLLSTENLVGVLGVRPPSAGTELTTSQMQLLQAFADQIAAALDRCGLATQAERVRLQVNTERLRNTLLSAVSHDLLTPLTAIAGAASLLLDRAGDDKSQASRRDLAESILDEADRLNRLVANLLDLTRLEAGAIQLHREWQPIDEVVEVVLRRMERHLRGRTVNVDLPADLPPVLIDGLLIQQVFVNLLDNALKFSALETPLELRGAVREGELSLEVADRGLGLPLGEEARIFEKFHRVDGRSRQGSGVGLTICRAIVELHGGRIVAENRPGGGAVFRFTLPLTFDLAGADGPGSTHSPLAP